MTPDEIEKAAQERGVTPKEILKEQTTLAADAAVEAAADPEKPVVRMQHVVITLADGRRGVFMGPELIREVEMKLNMVPKLVSVDFDPPRAVAVPIPREIPKEETSADPKVQEQPAEAAGDAGASVGEKA